MVKPDLEFSCLDRKETRMDSANSCMETIDYKPAHSTTASVQPFADLVPVHGAKAKRIYGDRQEFK